MTKAFDFEQAAEATRAVERARELVRSMFDKTTWFTNLSAVFTDPDAVLGQLRHAQAELGAAIAAIEGAAWPTAADYEAARSRSRKAAG